MKILVLNSGSSSVKYQLFDMTDESVIAKGIVEEVGSDNAIVTYKPTGKKEVKAHTKIEDHKQALKWIIDSLLDPENGVVKDVNEIAGVGNRAVHGGKISESKIATKDIVEYMETEGAKLAPLHNIPNILGVKAAEERLPNAVQTLVFDTAFHHDMPAVAYMYPIPYENYEKHAVRKYGFHGTSHKYVAHKAAEYLGKPIEELKIITCHLGNGASVAAVKNGKSIDTSMGFTPLEGLMMGTRCGDIDASIPLFLMEENNMTAKEMTTYLNKQCGLKGITGGPSDMRAVEKGWQEGDEKLALAFEMFFYRVKKYIGSYAFVLGGIDAIVFTGGIGEHSPDGRKIALSDLSNFGIEIDEKANKENAFDIGTGKVKILVIPTNEELAIARETVELINKK